ncbi:MAG: helix-turn-helix domain-containing protein [Muribaculaceae bacterium]|nr:helix-turn-helix domain-containing protein [Muribaculaceae bacterium]
MKETIQKRLELQMVRMRNKGYSYREIGEETGVSKSSVARILRNFVPANESSYELLKSMAKEKTDTERQRMREQRLLEEVASLKAELRATRRELDHQTLRAEVLDEIINVAEHKFNIEIRKKAGAKR